MPNLQPPESPRLDAETIRSTAADVLSRPDYDVSEAPDPWLLELIWKWLTWLGDAARWLFDTLWNVHPILAYLCVVVLVLVLVVLVTHIAYTFKTALAARREGLSPLAGRQRVRSPAELERAAREAAAAGDCILAVRLLFRACLLRIEAASRKPLRSGLTNREILAGSTLGAASDALRLFVDTIDLKWYADGQCTPQDLEACRLAYARVCAASEPSNADRT